jgi:pimeloyl-ACP methyl ester carboxylesterase
MTSVILLPGLACDDELWRDVAPALDAAGRVVVSDVHFRHDTLPAMAAALLAEQPGPLVLVGHSMGGMVALEMARQAPARVSALALLGSSARPDTPELLRLRSEAIEAFRQGLMDHVLWANVAFAFHPANAADDHLVQRYLEMIRRAGPAQLIAQNRAVMARSDARPRLGAIACPALVACGDADLITPAEHSHEMAALLPAARVEIIPDCGHMLTLEQPARVAALLREWLESMAS